MDIWLEANTLRTPLAPEHPLERKNQGQRSWTRKHKKSAGRDTSYTDIPVGQPCGSQYLRTPLTPEASAEEPVASTKEMLPDYNDHELN